MSRNKKVIILITILGVIALSIAGVFIYKNRKVDNIVSGENNKNQMQENIESENTMSDENSIENTETENIEQNNTVEDDTTSQNQIVEDKAKETTPVVQEQNTKTSTKKENSKTTTTTTNNTTTQNTNSSTNTENKDTQTTTGSQSIKVEINPDSYTKLDGGYAEGSHTIQIPESWNY